MTSASDLITEAEWLWWAEEDNKVQALSSSAPEHRISPKKGWGCVALLRNPNKEIPQQLLDDWARRVAGEAHYGANDRRLVDHRGTLGIPWPNALDGSRLLMDLLLATSNDPEPTYPTVQEIANAWNQELRKPGKEKAEYFRSNQRDGISTFQDQEIEELFH